MKPFNLEAALKGAPVVLRNDPTTKVLRIVHIPELSPYDIIAVLQPAGGKNYQVTYPSKGTYLTSSESYRDLMMASTQREGWIIVLKHPDISPYTSRIFQTEAEAKDYYSYGKKLAIIKITWEE